MLALALAALGLYGVMMYATLRRTSEFGLRMALGADADRVRRMVLGEAMRLVMAGTIVGVPLAIAATRLLRNQLFGVELVDVPSIVLARGARAERRYRGLCSRIPRRASVRWRPCAPTDWTDWMIGVRPVLTRARFSKVRVV